MTTDPVRQRLRILGDPASSSDERHDAMEEFRNDVQSDWSRPASWANDNEVLDAIVSAAGEHEPDGLVASSAAETLACLWLQGDSVDRARFDQLAEPAKAEVRAYFAVNDKLERLDPPS